jgi:nicotinate-nucleotide--dimethylbenzimidazole phosphoribosyltransferase
MAPLAAAFPAITDHCIAGHVSAEPGHARLLDRLGLVPLLWLGMRLGEASGAAVATGVIRAAGAAHANMATFAEAGVSEAG